ncbi:hypothetical protein CVT25_012266 [Psilocybe cyanescens]|uniref:Uncharacterized protein n=1 Tax=Psilocybe cyanescens TaxID=93625 RepID=A0A409XH59_PSICY|nr:hypothetical protein CVT25_012266 [Psilocybe cyanescens]
MSTFTERADFGCNLGALQIGSLLGVFLFGIITHQAYSYYRTYNNDIWRLKILLAITSEPAFVFKVFAIWRQFFRLLELGHTLSICFDVYRATINLYDEPQLLRRLQGTTASILFAGLIALLAQSLCSIFVTDASLLQGFLCRRIFRLLPNPCNYVGIVCFGVAVTRFGLCVFIGVESFSIYDTVGNCPGCSSWILVTFIAGTAVDVTIAISMLYYFLQKRRQSNMESSTKLIDMLLTYTIRKSSLSIELLDIQQSLIFHEVRIRATYQSDTEDSGMDRAIHVCCETLNARKRLREDYLEHTIVKFADIVGVTGTASIHSNHDERVSI